MTTTKGILATALILFCGAVWMGVPMSVFEEHNPNFAFALKVIATFSGIAGLLVLIFSYVNQKK